MGKLVDFEGYGLAEYPDDFTDAQIHDSWERNIKPILDAKKRVVLRENAAIANRNAEAANAENTIWQGAKSAVSDVGVGLMKGYVGIPEAIVGLANIPTRGYAGKWVEDAGIDFKGTKEYWDQKYSEGAKAAQAEVSQAEGFIPKGKALLDNPSALGQTIAESLPLMLGGAGLARLGLGAAKMIGPRAAAWAAGAAVPGSSVPLIAGAVGEGAIAAGSMAEGIRQQTEDRLLTWEQAGLSLASGALTGAIGIASGKVAKRLGIDDLDTFLVSGIPAGTAKRTLTERIARGLGGALTEGVLEEMPQSAQEQVANNLALKKPWNEGVAEAAAKGLLAGAVMGGAMGVVMPGGQSATPPPIPPPTTPPVQPPPLGSPQAPPALPGQVPKQPPSLPALSNQTLATPISSWVTAPNGPHVLGQSPNAFGVGQQVVQVSQSSGNFGKQGVVVSVAAPPAGGNPVVTVRFADGSQAKSDGKEFAFSEHFAQATAIKAGPLWTPPPPRPGTVPQPVPTNTNQQRRTPLDATEQLQAKINAARAVGDRALVRKLSIELDMMGTAAPVVKQPLPAQRTIKPSAPIASQDDEEGFVMPPLPPGVVAAPQAEPDEGFVMPALPPGVVAAPSSPKKPAAKAPVVVPQGAGQPITAKPSVSERLNALLKTGLVRMANAGQTTPDYEGLRARGGITMGIDTKTGELIVDEQNIKDISAAMAKGRVDIAEAIMDRLESAAAHESIHRLIFDGKKYLPGFANLVNTALSGKDAQLQQFASVGLKHLLAIEHYRNLFVSTGVTLEGTIAEQTQRILKNPGALALTFNELLAGHANTRGAWSAKENSFYNTTRKELLKRAGIPAAMDKPPVTLLPKEHTKWLADNSTYKPNAPAPVPQQVGLPVKPEGTPPVGQAKPKAGTRNRLTSPAAGQAPAEAKPTDVAKPTPAATGATAQKMPWEMTKAEFMPIRQKLVFVPDKEVGSRREPGHYELVGPVDPRESFTVGDAATFYRAGTLPKSGFSKDYKDNRTLAGVSVYTLPYANSMAGLKNADWYTGKGKIMGIGPDGEPLIKPVGKWSRFSASDSTDRPSDAHRFHVQQALREGKPVPESVLADYPDLKPTPAAAQPEPAAEQPATKPKRVARGSTLLARFNAETERLGPDILSFMVDSGLKVQSKSVAKARGKEYWNQNRGDYDGALRLALPTHNIIYGGSRGPDLLAQDAFEANVIKEPTPDAFWEAVNNASRRRRAAIGNESQDEKFLNEEVAAYERWMKATEEGAIRVSADELQVGDLMDVEGEKVEVIAKDADTGEVTLKDGRKFETQKLQDGESIYVERLIQLEPADKDEANFRGILAQAADSSSKLRPQDVERVMSEAGWDSDAFKAWLLKQPLSDDTRKAVEQWGKEEQTLTAAGFNTGDRVTVSGGDKFHQDVTGVIAHILNDGRILEIVRDGDFTSIRINLEDYKKIEKAFSLAPAESVEEQKARLAAEALKGEADAAAKAKADSLTNAINKPLTGTVGDIAQDDMLDPQGGLFNNSNPLGKQPAPPSSPNETALQSKTGSKPFYSRLNRAVEETPMQNATGFKWKGVINKWQKAKPTPTLGKSWLKGINRDEIDLVGVNDLEDGKTYSKQEVLDYLKANEVVVKDVTLGQKTGSKQFDFERDGYEWMPDEDGDGGNLTVNGRQVMRFSNETLAREAAAENFIEGADRDETHFSQYQLPGAVEGSYREVLLTVPEATEADIRRKIGEPYSASIGEGGYQVRTKSGAKFGVYSGSSAEQAIERARAVGPTDWALREFQEANWDDGHSQYRDIANPIVRLRFNERTTQDGKRMLFLEEVQAPQKAEFEKMPPLFQKNWREIAFKWALRKASEEGYDSVGWTTGEQQAVRYDLSKQISRIEVQKVPGSTQVYLAAYDHAPGSDRREYGRRVIDKMVNPGELESYIGKELAAKVETMEWTPYGHETPQGETITQDHKVLSGLDLKVGGEGLKKLYDVDFRNVVNGIPAVKKSGQKVGMVEIQGTNPGVAEKGFTITQSRTGSTWTIRKITQDPAYVGDGSGGLVGDVVKSGFSSRQEAARWADENIKIPGVPIHSLSLTPAIRESVMGGQALFRRSDTATGLPASAVEAHLAQAYGSVPNGVIRVVERPDLNFDGQVILDAATGEFLRIEINASKLNSLDDIDKILTHEFSHIVFRDEGVQSIIGSLTDQERAQIEADMTRLGYTPDSLQEEGGARGVEQLANAWRGRNWFTQVVGRVLAWASEHGLKMTRLAAEMIAARAVAKVKAEVFMADEASIQQVSMGSELALQSRVVPDNAADLEIATAGQQVAAQVESIYASYEAGAQSLSQLALEKKEFRQARAELNKLTSLASARMTQLPNPAPGMTPDPMEGISVQANQVVVGPEFSDKLTNLGVAHNAADAQAKQGAIFFERVADGVTTARERLKDLEAKRNHYISIKAPAADISQVENTINSNRAQIATLEQTEHDGVTAGQRADEIAAAESNKIDAEGKRDALKLAPVDDYFGGRMANLRELTEKAKASAALAKALMAGTTDPAELARLTAEFERFDKLPETARDALVAGKMTDAQLSSVVIALQHSFVEFDLAKANMDDLLLAEQTRILKDIAQAEKDYKAALGANLDTEAVVDAALRSARGSAGLVGSVSGAAKIDQLLLETAAISGMAQTLGQNIEQNRWLYDYLSGVRSTPGGILAFSKANADALGIGEDTLRKLVNAVQSSPALGSALVTLADHAAATRANNYALSLATTVPSISSLAAQAQASTVPSNAQALLNQANAAAATLASAVKPGVRATSKTAQLMSSSINQSLTQLAAVNNGASLFNQVANNPAFVAMRQNANGLNGLVINMIEPGPAKTTFLGFGTTSTVYHPELVINVDDDPAMSHRTQGHIYQWSEAAKRYRDDFDAAELTHRANPAANPTPESLGFDRAKVIGLRTALEKQVNGSFLEVSLMDEAARTSIPKVVRKMLKRSWFRQHDFVARLVGGIYGTDLRATQGRWIRGHLNARRVAARFQDMPDLQASAMASHGIKNISTYRSQIWNQMGGYGREFGSKLKVGFILPVSGQTITKEDMAFFKRTIDFEEQLRRFVTEVDNTRGVREKIGGQTFVRGGGSVGDYGMPRHLGRNATAFIADIISSYLNTKGFTVSSDLSAASTEAVPAFWNKRVDMLKQHILDSTRTDRAMRQDPTMRKAEMAIANRWLSGAVDPVSSLQDLAQLLAAELATVPGINPMDYAVRHLNSELIQYHEHAVRIKAEREDPSTRNSGLSIALSSDNEFTKPAAKLELPHSLYDYGALTTGERISAQSRANHEMLVEYANALRRAIGDLKNRINRFDNNQISEAEAARSYGGGMEELRDTEKILSASLVDFEAGYKLGADPELSPSALASELARFPVAGVLALPTVSIRNLTGGQLVVYLMERAMGYTGARLAMYNAIKNAPKALAKASYASALNIARFLDKNLLKTNKKQLEDIVDIIAKVALSPVLLALKNPTTIIAGVKSDLDQVQKLGYDTKMGFVDAFRQAWKESGLYANREEEEAALRSPTATKIGRVTLTAAKGINAFLGAVGVENSDQVLNSVNLVQSQMMETRLGEVAMKFGARLESLGITSIDPTDRRSILLAAEWSPFLNAQASLDSLGQLRLFLEGSAASEGFQLENALLKFYQETKAGKPTHIFSAAQFEAVQRGLLAQMNTSLPTNRASVAAGNRMWRILLTLQGYPSDAFLKLINTAVGGTRNRTVAAQAASKLPLLISIAMMAIIIGGMSDGASEYWKRKMQGIPSQNAGVLDRDFWQNKDKFMSGAGRFLAANMFYLGDVILGMQNQIQGNRGFDPASRVFPISLAQAFASAIQTTFSTYQGAGDMSDVATPMVDFFAKLTPGGMEIRNWFGANKMLRRSRAITSAEGRAADMELPKQGGQRSAGPTTIVKRNLESAVGAMEEARVSGDTEAYAKAEGQARAEMAKLENYYIKRETERGKSPEEAAKEAKAAVWRDYQEINPVSSALGGRRPTASEYQTITTGATGARAITQQAGISAWQQGANALFNKTGTVTRETASASSGGGTGGGSGGGYGATMTASSGVGRATSGRGRMVKAGRSRLTTGRKTRSSLSRPKFRTRLRAPRNRKVSIKRVRLTA